MAPKKKVAEEQLSAEAEEEEPPPAEPEIFKKCFRAGGQLYYGDCKAGSNEKIGTFLRHGYGRQVDLAVTPAGSRFSDNMAYETVVVGTYEGNWDEDSMSGQGTYKWSDGSSYEGHFVDGQLSGHGRFVWPDGSAYEGAWQSGTMNGQGRLDSRFDGKFFQGKFHRNCCQTSGGGKWVDILDKAKREEHIRIREGDATTLQVRRCAFGEYYAGSPRQQVMDEQKEALLRALEQIQADGLVPFVLAEASLGGSAIESLAAAGVVDPTAQGVSVRLAAIAKRRRRDCHRFFFDAIQSSLRTGNLLAVTFEDDDEGCSMLHEEQEDWTSRTPASGVPSEPVPEDWQLSHYFLPTAFPVDVFQPALFNGRSLARMFLPEAAQQPRPSGPPLPASAGGNSGGGEDGAAAAAEAAAGDAEGEAPAEVVVDSGADVATLAAARQLAATAAAGVTSGMVGQTGHYFEAGDVSLEAAGLPLAHCLRPSVVALGRLPNALGDEEVKDAVIARFASHVPLHSTVVLVLADSAEVPETMA